MSFLRGLQRVERILTSVADYMGANDHVQQPRPNQVIAPHIQNLALRSFPRGGGGTTDGEINFQSHETNETRMVSDLLSSSIIPPPPDSLSEREFVRYYEDILGSLQNTVLEIVQPSISNETKEQLYVLLRHEMNAQRMLDEAQSDVELAQKQGQSGEREQDRLANMHTVLSQVQTDLFDYSFQVLQSVNEHLFCLTETNEVKEWQLPLLQSTILCMATRQLASYASQGHAETTQVHNLLHNVALMKSILSNGGPKGGQLLSMLSIYFDILDASQRAKSGSVSNDIFHRLAVAVALEHASPIKVFDTDEIIDPIGRYTHYEDAYLQGELDPSFPILSVWELRMVANCDASNDEIEWCRDMLRNYRPDHIIERNEHWKYCMIVKSDVRYKCPEWDPNTPRTYKQMISVGGKCGPRAWFGRFACKSFGIPTWGVRQPGHAAMSKWTPNDGWVICLGGPNWKKSHWEDCSGVEFETEARARKCQDLYQNVLWLDCFAAINQEGCIGSQNKYQYLTRSVEQRFWSELSRLQKKVIATSAGKGTYPRGRDDKQIKTLVESILGRQISSNESTLIESDGKIVIPAGASLTPKSGKVIYMKSFYCAKSGKQVHLREDGSLEFQIRMKEDQSYRLIARIVNVHADPGPLKLHINSGYSKEDYEIEIPYTEGYWMETEPIEVHLPAGMNRLRFYREEGLGLTIKEFLLEPISIG